MKKIQAKTRAKLKSISTKQSNNSFKDQKQKTVAHVAGDPQVLLQRQINIGIYTIKVSLKSRIVGNFYVLKFSQ